MEGIDRSIYIHTYFITFAKKKKQKSDNVSVNQN